MIRRPRRSTLFPYTTLFRSRELLTAQFSAHSASRRLRFRLDLGLSLPPMEPTHVRQIALHVSTFGDQLRCDRNGNLFRRNCSNIEPDWGVDSVKQMCVQTFLLQFFKNGDGLPLRPNHPDVARRSLHRPAQHAHIVTMPAGDDHDVRRLAGRELRRGLVEIFGDDLLRVGKSLAVRIGFAIIHHSDVEPSDTRNLVKTCCYMACAENIKLCWRQNRLHKNLQRSAAHQAGIVLGILIQIERQGPRPLRFHHFARCLPHFGLNAAAADGADDRAVVPYQHLRGLERGNRAAGIDDGRYRATPSFFSQADDFLVQIHVDDYGSASGQGQTWELATSRASQSGPKNQKPRIITPGLLVFRQWVPSNTARIYRVSLSVASVKVIFVSDWEGGRLELQWLMKPLTGFADRVQYPLETPSRPRPAMYTLRFSGDSFCAVSHTAFGTFHLTCQNWHCTLLGTGASHESRSHSSVRWTGSPYLRRCPRSEAA